MYVYVQKTCTCLFYTYVYIHILHNRINMCVCVCIYMWRQMCMPPPSPSWIYRFRLCVELSDGDAAGASILDSVHLLPHPAPSSVCDTRRDKQQRLLSVWTLIITPLLTIFFSSVCITCNPFIPNIPEPGLAVRRFAGLSCNTDHREHTTQLGTESLNSKSVDP